MAPRSNTFYSDDAEMNAAIAEARRRLPDFQQMLAIDARRLVPKMEYAFVKAEFQNSFTLRIEHLWVDDVEFKDGVLHGTLLSEPRNIPDLTKGAAVTVPTERISDWAFRQCGQNFGGYTVRVMQRRGLPS